MSGFRSSGSLLQCYGNQPGDYNIGMRIIARSTLRSFWQVHLDAEQALKAWYDEVGRAK